MTLRGGLLSSTFLSSLVCGMLASPARAADQAISPTYGQLPAVDGINGKVEALGGTFARKSLAGVAGSIAVPLQGQFGVQVDGGVGTFANNFIGSGAAHLFWRNPAQGLVGLYADHTRWDNYGGVHVSHLGGEAEGYFGRWTIHGVAGVEHGNNASATSTTSTIIGTPSGGNGSITETLTASYLVDTTRFFDRVTLSYYLTDDWKGSIGHRYLGGRHALTFGTEYGIRMGRAGTMGSLFAQARLGENNYNHGIWGGFRVYFGKSDKSLIRRHREDDPIGESSAEPLVDIAESLGPRSSRVTGVCTDPGEHYDNGSCVGNLSDVRLKRDIALLERRPDGIGIYRYRYLWSDEVYVGVMAQEVVATVPQAVRLAADGYFRVDYAWLGTRLMRWDEWLAGQDAGISRAA